VPRVAAHRREAFEAERREQILQAALRLWRTRGFDATPVEDVAHAAGLAKGTVYLYFPTKDAILAAAVQRHSLLPDLSAFTGAMRDLPLADALPALTAQLWRRLRAGAPLVAVLFRELSLRPDDAQRFLSSVVLPANQLFADFLAERVRAGELRDLDTFVAARSLVGMLVMFLWTQEILGGKRLRPIDDDAITQTVSALFLRGVLAGDTAARRAPTPRTRSRAGGTTRRRPRDA
jgi:AcrR family transcriptional regulator